MRMASTTCVMVFLLSLTAASAIGQTARPAGRAPVVVKMYGDNLTFDPPLVTVRRGQTVEWQNLSRGMIHTVTADPAKADNKADVGLPPQAKPFDSGYMKPGDSFRHTFTVRGTYRYVCVTHEAQRMVGQVVVK